MDNGFEKYWELLVLKKDPIIDEIFGNKFKSDEERTEIQKWDYMKNYLNCLKSYHSNYEYFNNLIYKIEKLKNKFNGSIIID